MIRRTLATLALAAAVSACGGGGAAPVTGGPSTDGLASLTLTHPEGAVQVGDTLVMQVEAKDGNGQTVAGAQPQFTSSDATVATVDAAGVVRGVRAGAATIQATLTAGGVTRTATFAIAVLAPTQPPTQSIAAFTLNPATATLIPGAWIQFEPVATDASGARVTTLPTVAWTLADPSKATLSAGRVTAAAAGSTTVTASFTAEGRTWTATATVVVTAPTPPPPPASVSVQGIEDAFSPSAVTIPVGGTVTWTMVDEEHDVTWTGAAPAGGNTGRIDDDESASRTFSQPGTYAYVCERHDGEHGGTVTVQGAQETVLTSVRITPAGGSVAVGGTLQLTATPLDQLGREMTGVAAAQWSSASTAAATVGPTGAVTGLAPGTAAITARISHGGTAKEATVSVTVANGGTTPPPPPGPPSTATVTTPGESFSPATVTIAAGGTVTWQFTGSTRHNVTFSGTAPPGGNIPDTNAGGTAQRQFTTAGTYSYSCTRHDGMNGTVVVQP
jgi:trimeric autotransporter adhesin